MDYRIIYKSGVTFMAESKTLTGAKREASLHACSGFNCVFITVGVDSNSCSDPVAVKYESENKWVNL